MSRRVAIAVWQGRVSPVFDVSREVVVLDVDGGAIVSRRTEALGSVGLSERVVVLRNLGVQQLVCGAVSRSLHGELVDAGIELLSFVSGTQDDVIEALLAGSLSAEAFAMPGCCRGHGRRGSGGTRGCGGGGRGESGGGGAGRGGRRGQQRSSILLGDDNRLEISKGDKKMGKIAVTSTGPELTSAMDSRFGRCSWFIIIDPDSMEFESLENDAGSLGGGAGIQTAQMLAHKGVSAVLTGNCGPNAHQTLSAAGIAVHIGMSGSVEEAVSVFKGGGLKAASGPNVESHSGMKK